MCPSNVPISVFSLVPKTCALIFRLSSKLRSASERLPNARDTRPTWQCEGAAKQREYRSLSASWRCPDSLGTCSAPPDACLGHTASDPGIQALQRTGSVRSSNVALKTLDVLPTCSVPDHVCLALAVLCTACAEKQQIACVRPPRASWLSCFLCVLAKPIPLGPLVAESLLSVMSAPSSLSLSPISCKISDNMHINSAIACPLTANFQQNE